MLDREQTIVVVDDDVRMGEAVNRLLTAAGFHALAFRSAEALLQSGVTAKAACLVLDVQLPGLSGFELNRQLVGAGTKLPVVFMTAYDAPSAREDAQQAGAIAFFTKPFSGHRLVSAIRRALDSTNSSEPTNPS
jgi:FixJ family two-component response regulator